MNCPYCNFHFEKLASTSTLEELQKEDIIPALCEQCANISILMDGEMYKLEEEQLEAFKTSPAYKNFMEPIRNALLEHIEKNRA